MSKQWGVFKSSLRLSVALDYAAGHQRTPRLLQRVIQVCLKMKGTYIKHLVLCLKESESPPMQRKATHFAQEEKPNRKWKRWKPTTWWLKSAYTAGLHAHPKPTWINSQVIETPGKTSQTPWKSNAGGEWKELECARVCVCLDISIPSAV